MEHQFSRKVAVSLASRTSEDVRASTVTVCVSAIDDSDSSFEQFGAFALAVSRMLPMRSRFRVKLRLLYGESENLYRA